jgi:subtilisin-like proprotein convertase family protein
MKKALLIFSLFIGIISNNFAQVQNKWALVDKETTNNLSKVNRANIPNEYFIFKLDLIAFKNSLINAPLRSTLTGKSNLIIELPNSEGILEHYRVMETPIMEDGLALKFPMIKSYAAQGIENPSAIARFSVTQFGLHSMTMSSGQSTSFIDPFTTDYLNYIVYSKSSLNDVVSDFSCATLGTKISDEKALNLNRNTDDKKLRTYRLAQSCTAEYGNIFAGTTGTIADKKANIQAQMAITMTRVNGVYENDLAITMVFIANNDLLIYLGDTATDPWSGEYNLKTGQTIDANVGFSNYDIGHNFNTSGGGNAGCIGCICSTDTNVNGNHKGTGMTGRSNPTGDPFDIDYVAHEMGHQFGGFHTQSSSGCRSGNGQTEVEPGSGSTIMGYAGICATNVQNASDAYFAYVTVRDILENVKNGISSTCAQVTNIANNPPTVNAGRDYVIPKSTAFVLTAEGSDPDAETITYSWEQNDPESPSSSAAPVATRVAGPNFRSLISTTSNKRYFPKLATVLAGSTTNTWEAVPSVARNLNFSVLVRDNHAGGGQTASDLMKVTVKSTAGPFVMTSPNTNVSWPAGTNQTVTWNVAGTDSNGVDAKYVDIYLSANGGQDFSTLLASQVPNDGSEIITIPNLVGTQNRIMVKGFDNIFYDLSNTNFTITAPDATFAPSFSGIAGEQTKLICAIADVNFNINLQNLNGFTSNTTFSATGFPVGANVSFSPVTTNTNGIVVMTVALPITTISGFYSIEVTATSGAVSKVIPYYLGLGIGAINLLTPLNEAIDQNTSLNLNWQPTTNANAYDIEVSTTSDFATTVATSAVLTNSFSVNGLLENTDYFWRVKPKNENCNGIFGTPYKFKTGVFYCFPFSSTGNPITISASGTPTINSIISVSNSFILSDINVSVKVNHTYINELTATLISPSGTQIKVFDGLCTATNISNIDATFDDAGNAIVCSNNPGVSGTVKSKENLTAFNGQNATGNWTLRIKDNGAGDGGALVNWSMSMCSLTNISLSTNENKFENFALYPNPNNGSFNIQLLADVSNKIEVEVYDLSGRQIFNKSFENKSIFNENIVLDKIASGIYLVNIKNGKKVETRKIIVN